MKTTLGVCCALSIHALAAALGISAMIMKSALLFSLLKYIGAVPARHWPLFRIQKSKSRIPSRGV